ncbi:uncharacterized protein LOC117784615 [Drosophila innubila]|uniref:uncharacterized protein LOC117784615 n=1 Tax=Drosophila innubila TaxID=198719 RepID=UPI00148DB5AD|nr:uncharacterized protein LOC117784615 [Drosophila innubila]
MGKKKSNPRQVSIAERAPYQKSVKNTAQERSSVSVPNTRENFESVPRQRGRPRKVPLDEAAAVREDDVGAVISKALHLVKTNNKPILTQQNGFSRNLKADAIMGAFLLDGELVFAVRFKGRKLPQFIQAQEVHVRAPILYIQYYVANMNYD